MYMCMYMCMYGERSAADLSQRGCVCVRMLDDRYTQRTSRLALTILTDAHAAPSRLDWPTDRSRTSRPARASFTVRLSQYT